jgi:putative DNA primase/helicase
MAENDGPPAHSAGAGDPDDNLLPGHATGDLSELQQAAAFHGALLTSDEDARRSELCEAAVAYARRGWRVVPVRHVTQDGSCSCSRGEECPSPGKHPVHDAWQEAGSSDPLEVAGWWRPEPEGIAREWFPWANIGIVTGRSSGIFVLDMDTYAGGSQTLAAYERRNGELPETRVHSTGRGGTHYFFAHPGFDIRNSARKALGKGLDIRGENGFVVAPPSIAAGPYELNPAHDIDPAEAPGWLLDLLRNHDKSQNGSALSGTMPAESTGAARRYAEAALAAEARTMREAPEGTRNDTLNRCAFALGTLGGAGLVTEEVAFAVLREAAQAVGLPETEIRSTFLSGWRKGLESPRSIEWKALGTDWPTRPRTEFGLADRMADHYGDLLRWCPEQSTWLTYHNGVWRSDQKEAGEWYAQQMIRRLEGTEALSYDDDPEQSPDGTEMPSARAMFMEWVGKQQTKRAVAAASALSRGLPLMRMSQSTFDASPTLLNCKNGVVDLASGSLLPHSPEQRMTLQADASYYPGEPAPQWEAFLRRVQPDPAMRAYIQRVAGYCATGLTTEQVFFLWHGKGANGKSVAQSVLARVLGSYSQTIPTDTLMASSVDGRIPNDVARMAGRRFLVASETKAGKAMDEQQLKALTGGDTITARYMRAEWFEFKPVGKIQLTTNHLPKMSDDAATWRRIHLITWPVQIPEHERDGFLQQRLIEEESAGIFAWIVAGAMAWQEEGLSPPDAVHAARDAYQQDEDEVGQFVEECLDVLPPVKGALGRDCRTIWNTYSAWARSDGHNPIGQKALTARLGKKYDHVRSNGWNGFPALQVKVLGGGE